MRLREDCRGLRCRTEEREQAVLWVREKPTQKTEGRRLCYVRFPDNQVKEHVFQMLYDLVERKTANGIGAVFMISEVFARRFKDAMDAKGDNIYSVAMKHGVSVTLVAECAYKGKIPPVRKLVKLCSSYGLSIDFLTGFCDENKLVKSGIVYDCANGYMEEVARKAKKVFPGNHDEVSRISGVKYTDVVAIKARGKSVKTESFVKICKAYDVSLDWLLGLSDDGGLDE